MLSGRRRFALCRSVQPITDQAEVTYADPGDRGIPYHAPRSQTGPRFTMRIKVDRTVHGTLSFFQTCMSANKRLAVAVAIAVAAAACAAAVAVAVAAAAVVIVIIIIYIKYSFSFSNSLSGLLVFLTSAVSIYA